jgi:hypothetical protein
LRVVFAVNMPALGRSLVVYARPPLWPQYGGIEGNLLFDSHSIDDPKTVDAHICASLAVDHRRRFPRNVKAVAVRCAIERRAGRDKRAIALYLTKRGKTLREALLKGRLSAIRPLLSPLSATEHDTLAALLHKLLASMETTDLERCTLCRLCDGRVCANCPIPANFRNEGP